MTYFPFGLAATWYLAFCVVLPGRNGWRGLLRGALYAGGAVGPVVVMAALTPFANRYIIQMLLPIACAVPIACAQLFRTVTPRRLEGVVCAVLAFGLLKFGWEADVSERFRPVAQNPYDHFNRIVKEVEDRIEDEDLFGLFKSFCQHCHVAQTNTQRNAHSQCRQRGHSMYAVDLFERGSPCWKSGLVLNGQ